MTEIIECKHVAVAVVRNTEGKILVQRRIGSLIPEANNKWEFPGGVIEPGETLEQAAARECLEETGCAITLIRLLFTESRVWNKEDGSKLQVELSMFEAQHIAGEAKPLDAKKVGEVKWVTKKEAARLDALPNLHKALSYLT